MRKLRVLVLIFVALIFPAMGYQQQPTCEAPALSDQAVKEIIDKERTRRPDLPAPFPQSRWIVQRQLCHYVYTEYGLPEAPEYNQSIWLNQRGVIVDAAPGHIKCPDRNFNKEELAQLIKTEREKKRAIPAELSNSEPRVERMRCTYLYFEYAVPRRKGDYQVYTIDPFGEVMSVYRSKPY